MGVLLTGGRYQIDLQVQPLDGKPRAGESDRLPFMKEPNPRLGNPKRDQYTFARDCGNRSFGARGGYRANREPDPGNHAVEGSQNPSLRQLLLDLAHLRLRGLDTMLGVFPLG